MAVRDEEERYMRLAVELALRNVQEGRGGPFAALVVRDGEVLAAGTNQVTPRNDPTAHAEVVAIREACARLGSFQLTGCDLYASCEPCPMCLGAIYWARPARVFYASSREDAAAIGFDDAFIYDEIARDPAMRRIPFVRLQVPGAEEAMRAWLGTPDKVPY